MPRLPRPGDKDYVPISSKWRRNTLTFEVARILRNKTEPRDAVTVSWLSEVIFGHTDEPAEKYYRHDQIKKAFAKIRADDPDGQILLIYAEHAYDPITRKTFIRYYNHITRDQLQPVHSKMIASAQGLITRVERNDEIVEKKWEERKKSIEMAMGEYAAELSKLEDEKRELEAEKEIPVEALGHHIPPPPKNQLYPECHICGAQVPAHKWSEHQNRHYKERVNDLKELKHSYDEEDGKKQ